MTSLRLIAASALALTAAGCGERAPAGRAALDCPPTEGVLSRTAAPSGGEACTYVAGDGTEVTLRLLPARDGLDAALAGLETGLLAGRTKAAEGPAAAEDEATPPEVGETRISLPGIHIVANDANDAADVKVGPLTVNAVGDAATVRIRRDVRLRGEGLSLEKRGVRASFLYAGQDLPDGYRFVGYEAGGPRRGPIAVAVVKSKSERGDGGEIYAAVRRLVRLNGGA